MLRMNKRATAKLSYRVLRHNSFPRASDVSRRRGAQLQELQLLLPPQNSMWRRVRKVSNMTDSHIQILRRATVNYSKKLTEAGLIHRTLPEYWSGE